MYYHFFSFFSVIWSVCFPPTISAISQCKVEFRIQNSVLLCFLPPSLHSICQRCECIPLRFHKSDRGLWKSQKHISTHIECLTINAVHIVVKAWFAKLTWQGGSRKLPPPAAPCLTHTLLRVLSEVLRTHLTVVIPPVANPSLYNSHETSMCVYWCACLCAMYHQPLTDLHYLGFGANQVLARSAGHRSSIIAHNCDTCLQRKEH